MAVKRMLSMHIVGTDAFLEMPATSQLLYFHLSMRADDEGFVGNPKMIMRMVGMNEDDLKVLIGKRFILTFESGVVVIKHWLIHNTIRMDRFNKTNYDKEKKTLQIKVNKAYTEERQPLGNHSVTQVKLSKVKLREESTSPEKHLSYLLNIPKEDLEEFVEKFNATPDKIKEKGDDLLNYCKAKGKQYKNYKSFLRNAIKNDFGIRPPRDKELQERIKRIQEKSGVTSSYAKKLKDKFKMK